MFWKRIRLFYALPVALVGFWAAMFATPLIALAIGLLARLFTDQPLRMQSLMFCAALLFGGILFTVSYGAVKGVRFTRGGFPVSKGFHLSWAIGCFVGPLAQWAFMLVWMPH